MTFDSDNEFRHQEVKYYPAPPDQFDYPSPSIYDCLKVIDQASWNQLDITWPKIEIRYFSTLYNVGPYSASMFLFLELQYHLEAVFAENRNYLRDSEVDAILPMPARTTKELPEDLFIILDILQEFSPFFPANGMVTISPIPILLEWCTPKVRVLAGILAEYYSHTPTFQGIIFVEQRQIASTLAKILPAILELAGKIKCAFIVGQGVNRDGISKQTDRFPGDPVKLFRERSVNICVLTTCRS